ncbi:MAG: hypothetical protein ABIZ04_09145 [Opitutus sp.]
MSNRLTQLSVLLTAMLTLTSAARAAKSEIPSVAARREIVAAAAKLVTPDARTPIPANVNQPFNPEAFGRPDAEELAAIAAAKAAEAAALNKTKPASEADLLERIAERVAPSGTVTMNGEPLLIFGQKRVSVGDRLTVTYDGRDYTVEITSIQRFTFTLRLNRAEITRRINPGKNP